MKPTKSYYAVIFSSKLKSSDPEYSKMASKMEQLVQNQEGYLSHESVRDSNLGITISYWESMECIQKWRKNTQHQEAIQKGIHDWYESYSLKVCKVERESFK